MNDVLSENDPFRTKIWAKFVSKKIARYARNITQSGQDMLDMIEFNVTIH